MTKKNGSSIDSNGKSANKQKNDAEKRKASLGEDIVTIDRRHATSVNDSDMLTTEDQLGQPKLERRKKVQRRRQIDPTTCERDYSRQEIEFMNAMNEYKRKSGRSFPTCSEVLEVIRSLGYVQQSSQEPVGVSNVSEIADSSRDEEELVEVEADFVDVAEELEEWEV